MTDTPSPQRLTAKLLQEDRLALSHAQFPIVTLSASFRDVVEAQRQLTDFQNFPDIVLSRAHYSMAYGTAVEAWGSDEDDPVKAWLVDPTNYVDPSEWSSVAFMERVGKVMARHGVLTFLKKMVLDQRARSRLPIEEAITSPLLSLVKDVKRPIISFHVELGNILAQKTNKTIIQAVTDPHVREQYTDFAHKKNMYFAVFDEPTRTHFLEISALRGKKVDPKRVVVTGPFIDPRVLAVAAKKTTTGWKNRPLRILLTTGGLGTNKAELAQALRLLLPLTKSSSKMPVQIMYYVGTNEDHARMARRLANNEGVTIGEVGDKSSSLRILGADDIVAANELLIQYGFPWADLVIAKPSGDMVYDAAAAGCAVILLSSWGEWEDKIASIFTQAGIARHIEVEQLPEQLAFLTQPIDGKKSWLESAMNQAQNLPPEFTDGTKNILKLARQVGGK
jgi:UDP-N-acetylglucosamine:LPS N-acetylglucosamine transferase